MQQDVTRIASFLAFSCFPLADRWAPASPAGLAGLGRIGPDRGTAARDLRGNFGKSMRGHGASRLCPPYARLARQWSLNAAPVARAIRRILDRDPTIRSRCPAGRAGSKCACRGAPCTPPRVNIHALGFQIGRHRVDIAHRQAEMVEP